MTPIEQRLSYQADGKLWLPVWILGSVAALVAAVAVGWLLSLAFQHGFYFFILMPVLGGGILLGVLRGAVRFGHCRNRWAAAGLGLVVGLAAYVGYYEFCMLDALPPHLKGRVDLLPHYVLYRLQTDRVHSTHDHNKEGVSSFAMNCIFCGLDLAFLLSLTVGGAWRRAGWAYCHEIGQWMRREKITWAAGSGPRFVEVLASDKLAEFVARASAGGNQKICCRLTVEYAAPDSGVTLTYPVFATLTDVPVKPAWFRPNWIPTSLLRQVALETAEVLVLRPLLPQLAKLLETQHPELSAVPADVMLAPASAPAGEVASILTVDVPAEQRVLTPRSRLGFRLVPFLPLASLLVAVALIGGGVYLMMATKSLVLLLLGAVPGLICGAWGVYAARICEGTLEGRWIAGKLRDAIGRRSDAVVDPSDDGLLCMSLVSRASLESLWTQLPTDVMLVKIDPSRRYILMEGDRDRYCIPTAAIVDCAAQCFFHRLDTHNSSQIWLLRLLVSCPEGSRELLLRRNPTRWVASTNKRRRRGVEEISQQITACNAGKLAGAV